MKTTNTTWKGTITGSGKAYVYTCPAPKLQHENDIIFDMLMDALQTRHPKKYFVFNSLWEVINGS